jgi:Recombinase
MRNSLVAAGAACALASPVLAVEPSNFDLATSRDLVALCSCQPHDPLYAEALQFCYGFLAGVAQFHRAMVQSEKIEPLACPKDPVGIPPLGYDVRDRKLVVNPAEAELVRLIFQRFLDLGSALLLIRELNAQGYRTKSWTTQSGTFREGRPWFGSGAVSRPKTLFVQAAWARPATFALVDTYQLW